MRDLLFGAGLIFSWGRVPRAMNIYISLISVFSNGLFELFGDLLLVVDMFFRHAVLSGLCLELPVCVLSCQY